MHAPLYPRGTCPWRLLYRQSSVFTSSSPIMLKAATERRVSLAASRRIDKRNGARAGFIHARAGRSIGYLLDAVPLFGTAVATVVPAYSKLLYPPARELRQQATLDCVNHGLGAVGSTQL